jgi:hypothetical protein
MTQQARRHHPWLVMGLLLLGISARLAPHPPNATPLTAIALFGGAYLSRRWSLLLPLLIVVISDAFIGWHATMPFSWAAFTLTVLLAWRIHERPSAARVAGSAIAGSALFFLVTNFGVWVAGGLYPPTGAGLRQCFIAAIPFFRNSLIGDLIYAAAIFGGYALASRAAPAWVRRCESSAL